MHPALPQTMTPENLAVWIQENQVDKKIHSLDIPLTPEDIQHLEHKSSVASRAIDDLNTHLDVIKKLIKKGTPTNEQGEPQPVAYTIPPTKGTDVLESNRKFADDTIKMGYRIEHVEVYGIPYPEEEKIIYVDVEGNPFDQYDHVMTPDQVERYGKPILKALKDEEEGSAMDLFN